MSHTARALVLHCMDFRFLTGIRDFLLERGLKDSYDLVALAGAAKNLVEPLAFEDKELMLRQMEISQRLHGVQEVLLVNHLDCGAYGGTSAFTTREDEHERHVTDLRLARETVADQFPNLTVFTFLASVQDGRVHFAEVTDRLTKRAKSC